MSDQLQKALDLSRKTGDRIIVFDTPKSESPFVVMVLSEYEKLVIGKSEVRGLTEDELLDKINRDIAVWKSEQESGEKEVFVDPGMRPKQRGLSPISGSDFANRFSAFDYREQIEEEAMEIEREIEKNQAKKRNHWVIPADRKEAAEEIIEEDTHYLEDIKF